MEFIGDVHTITRMRSHMNGFNIGLNDETIGGHVKAGLAQVRRLIKAVRHVTHFWHQYSVARTGHYAQQLPRLQSRVQVLAVAVHATECAARAERVLGVRRPHPRVVVAPAGRTATQCHLRQLRPRSFRMPADPPGGERSHR